MPFRPLYLIVSLTFVASFCSELPAQPPPHDTLRAHVLGDRIAALSPSIRRDEALRVAECAYATSKQLRHDYGVIGGPPSFQNFLVNLGIRKARALFPMGGGFARTARCIKSHDARVALGGSVRRKLAGTQLRRCDRERPAISRWNSSRLLAAFWPSVLVGCCNRRLPMDRRQQICRDRPQEIRGEKKVPPWRRTTDVGK